MQIRFERNRTYTIVVMYSLYLYFLGLSLRNTSKALVIFKDNKRSHVSVWNWIQRFAEYRIYKRKRIIIDETVIQIGSQHFWLWFCIEPIHSSVLGIYISESRNMLVAEKFIRSLVSKYGRHPVYTDGGTWYDEACNILKLKHYLHSSIEKSLMERESTNILRTEPRVLMTTIHVSKMNVIYFMYITGYNSLYLCIMIKRLKIISLTN